MLFQASCQHLRSSATSWAEMFFWAQSVQSPVPSPAGHQQNSPSQFGPGTPEGLYIWLPRMLRPTNPTCASSCHPQSLAMMWTSWCPCCLHHTTPSFPWFPSCSPPSYPVPCCHLDQPYYYLPTLPPLHLTEPCPSPQSPPASL